MDWNSSVLWGIIGLVGGFLVSLLFYLLSKDSKILLFNIKTQLVADNCAGELDIKYKGEDIALLYESTLILKNIGLSVISYDDFANKDGLYIYSEGKVFLDFFTFPMPLPLNAVQLRCSKNEKDPHHICINFEFLRKKQIAVCTIFHTSEIHLSGVLKKGNIYYSKKLKP